MLVRVIVSSMSVRVVNLDIGHEQLAPISVLADYRRKLGDVVTEVDNITALATTEAKTLAAETRQSLKEYFDRRIKLAEEKIARAEMEAVREFRSVAVDAAIAAAQNLIAAKLTPDRAKKLVSESIKALKSKLN